MKPVTLIREEDFIASVAEGREGGWVREIEKMVI